MSQYPSPYSPPPDPQQYTYTQANYGNYGHNPYEAELLRPARRAGLMMSILGGLMFLAGVCCVGMGLAFPWDQLLAQQPAMGQQLQEALGGMPVEQAMRIVATTIGVVGLVFGIAQVVLGIFVRRGSLGAAVTGIVVVCLVLLYPVLMLVSTPFTIGKQGPREVGANLCMATLWLLVYGLLLAWLIQAARATGRIREWRASYQAQYAQYQAQYRAYQQAYAQQSYGGYQPPQQQPPPSPPPPIEPPLPGA